MTSREWGGNPHEGFSLGRYPEAAGHPHLTFLQYIEEDSFDYDSSGRNVACR